MSWLRNDAPRDSGTRFSHPAVNNKTFLKSLERKTFFETLKQYCSINFSLLKLNFNQHLEIAEFQTLKKDRILINYGVLLIYATCAYQFN